MELWQYLLAAGLAVALLLKIRSAVKKKRNQKKREFDRKLETVLQPRETVKVVCPQKKGSCILTSKRLLFETKEGFTAVPFGKIKRVQGVNEEGKRTTSVPKMVSLTIQAEHDYTVKNNCEEFAEFAKQLIKKTAKKPGKKTAAKEAGK